MCLDSSKECLLLSIKLVYVSKALSYVEYSLVKEISNPLVTTNYFVSETQGNEATNPLYSCFHSECTYFVEEIPILFEIIIKWQQF